MNIDSTLPYACVALGFLCVSTATAGANLTLSCEAYTQFCLNQENGSQRCDPQKKTLHMLNVEEHRINNLDEYGFLTFDGSCEHSDETIECRESKEATAGTTSRSFVLSRITGEGSIDIMVNYDQPRNTGSVGRTLRGQVFCEKSNRTPIF